MKTIITTLLIIGLINLSLLSKGIAGPVKRQPLQHHETSELAAMEVKSTKVMETTEAGILGFGLGTLLGAALTAGAAYLAYKAFADDDE